MELVGGELFADYLPASTVSIRDIVDHLRHVWVEGWHVSIPAWNRRTLQSEDRVLLATGYVIHILPDPFVPGTHDNAVDAFSSYNSWGCDVGIEGIPTRDAYISRYLQIIMAGDDRLVDFSPGESDEALRGSPVWLRLPLTGLALSNPR